MKRLAPLLLAGAALGHDVPHPRSIGLRISKDELRLRVDSETPAGERAQALRLAFDRNRDGRLDAEEQHALALELARAATLRTKLFVDGEPAPLETVSISAERADLPATSTSLLAVRVLLRASWPAHGSTDWLFRHRVELRDEDPSGHVPVVVECVSCSIADSSSGLPDGDFVRGANTPLVLKLRL